ncbi:MAG: 2-oxoacid:acceptor oxidoreductase family protein [FCB group bacterium]|jgi:2-oxoglutarate ferredoxin oxidoreductase subunit gamma|nr:2-oxoacid:acceptor oxidoreductase family protein [FCB group bacterium]
MSDERAVVAEPSLMQVRIAGYGGQGVVLAGMLLGRAASLYDGKEAVFMQSYGPEARGGASSADVIISDAPVDYPLVTNPDVLMVLFQEAYMAYRPGLAPGGTLIIEGELVKPSDGDTGYHSVPATRIAQEELGKKIFTNVIALGYLVGLTGVVTRESVEEALRSTVKPATVDLNLRALALGYDRAVAELEKK